MLEIGDGVFEVKATNGDTHLGGDDWDNRIMDWMLDEFKREHGMDLRKQPDALQRIKEEAEKAKIALSSAQVYEINLPFITADASGPKHLSAKLTRAKMEQLCDDLFERTIGPVKNCLKDAGVTAEKMDELVLVGGMTRMPRVVRDRANRWSTNRRIRASIPMKWSRSARPSRPACSRARSRTCCCWT